MLIKQILSNGDKYSTILGFENGEMIKRRSLHRNPRERIESGSVSLMFYTHCIFFKAFDKVLISYRQKYFSSVI